MLYWNSALPHSAINVPLRLMRLPTSPGPPQIVLEEPAAADPQSSFDCPQAAHSPCVLAQKEGNDLVFYYLDPVHGKGGKLAKIGIPSRRSGGWALSTDGSRIAVAFDTESPSSINILKLSDASWQVLAIEPRWSGFSSICWTAAGDGFFVTARSADSFNLLHVTRYGKVYPLLSSTRRIWFNEAISSPDGKYLAYQAKTWDSNVWMLENF